ncbi:hypothetical protein C1645_849073 [Glomus cerebriforme]|uniref:Ubiquitin-like domain-containing protein n=1 Tax=Glomus cerebriforme TaxID=658196 RepID=A0A397T333_9GLOM|nr:hypothetical protein C1645_849073 [Glomus cerebriforme]
MSTNTDNASIVASALTSLTGLPVITQADCFNQILNGNNIENYQNINPLSLHSSYLVGEQNDNYDDNSNPTDYNWKENENDNQQYVSFSDSQSISYPSFSFQASSHLQCFILNSNNLMVSSLYQQISQQIHPQQIQPQICQQVHPQQIQSQICQQVHPQQIQPQIYQQIYPQPIQLQVSQQDHSQQIQSQICQQDHSQQIQSQIQSQICQQGHPQQIQPQVSQQDYSQQIQPQIYQQNHPQQIQPQIYQQNHPQQIQPQICQQIHPQQIQPQICQQIHPQQIQPQICQQIRPQQIQPQVPQQDYSQQIQPQVSQQDYSQRIQPQICQQIHPQQIQPQISQKLTFITIKISTLNGQIIPINNVPIISKISAIKFHIESKTRIPSNQQRLSYSGILLKDNLTLIDYNILNNNTTINLIGQNNEVISFIDSNFLDPMYDCDFTNVRDDKTFMRGSYEYRRPCGWKRIAVKVLNKYENNAWLGKAAKKGSWRYESDPEEWPVSYHGTDQFNAKSIAETGFDITKGKRFKFGYGIYSTPDIKVAALFANKFIHNNEIYCLVFQNRVNPKTLEKINTSIGEYWISPKSDDIRPYGICIKKLGRIQS